MTRSREDAVISSTMLMSCPCEMSTDGKVLYEYPFSERVRTLLRLEDLFDKLVYFCAQEHPYCHHTALLTLFEILEVTSRADLKSRLAAGARAPQAVAAGVAQQPAGI